MTLQNTHADVQILQNLKKNILVKIHKAQRLAFLVPNTIYDLLILYKKCWKYTPWMKKGHARGLIVLYIALYREILRNSL